MSLAEQLHVRVCDRKRWQCALGSLPSLILAAMFWRQNVPDPLTAPSLLLDRSLQVITLCMAVAIFAVLLARAALAVVGALVLSLGGLVLGSTITMAGLVRPEATKGIILLAIVTIACSYGVLTRFGARAGWLKGAGGKTAAALLAAAVPLLQFWSGTSFLPSRTEAALTQDVSVETVNLTDGMLHSELSVRATNTTSARVLIIISQTVICWWKADEEPIYEVDALTKRSNCRTEHPINERAWIPTESDLTYQTAITTPADHPRLIVISRIAFARGDRLRTDADVDRHTSLDRCTNVDVVRIQEESRFKGLAQEDKFLVYADYDGDGGRNFFFTFGPVSECPKPDRSPLSDYYGATLGRVVVENWLTPPKQDAPTGAATTAGDG